MNPSEQLSERSSDRTRREKMRRYHTRADTFCTAIGRRTLNARGTRSFANTRSITSRPMSKSCEAPSRTHAPAGGRGPPRGGACCHTSATKPSGPGAFPGLQAHFAIWTSSTVIHRWSSTLSHCSSANCRSRAASASRNSAGNPLTVCQCSWALQPISCPATTVSVSVRRLVRHGMFLSNARFPHPTMCKCARMCAARLLSTSCRIICRFSHIMRRTHARSVTLWHACKRLCRRKCVALVRCEFLVGARKPHSKAQSRKTTVARAMLCVAAPSSPALS